MEFKDIDKFANSMAQICYAAAWFIKECGREVTVLLRPRIFNDDIDRRFYMDHIERMASRYLKEYDQITVEEHGDALYRRTSWKISN